MTAAINYIAATRENITYTGSPIERENMHVLLDAIKQDGRCADVCAGGVAMGYSDAEGYYRETDIERYRVRAVRVGSIVEVSITEVALVHETGAMYTVGVFEHPVDALTGMPVVDEDARLDWYEQAWRPRAVAMMRSVWGRGAMAAHNRGRRFCTPETAATALLWFIERATMWAALMQFCETSGDC